MNGNYEIHTIRPARYPDNTIPAHIHSAIKTAKGLVSWIPDFVFRDDTLVDEKYLSSYYEAASGVVDLTLDNDKTWKGKRDIIIKP